MFAFVCLVSYFFIVVSSCFHVVRLVWVTETILLKLKYLHKKVAYVAAYFDMTIFSRSNK